MASYFASVKSFGDVPIVDAGVDMTSFLEASDGLAQILDYLGSAVFGLINVDIKATNTALRTKHKAAPGAVTLESFVRSNKDGINDLIAMLRYLLLIGKALKDLKEDQNAQTHVCFQKSYDTVLGPHDSFVIRGVVRVAIRSAPSRNDIFSKLAQGGSGDSLDEEMTKWLEGLVQIVDHMATFMKEGRYGQV